MKKVLLSILLVLCLKEGVGAKTYYSDYSEFSDYSLVKIESSDLVNVDVKRVYNKYFSVAKGDYYRLDENPVFYPYVNVNIYKDTEFTNWSNICPEDRLGRIIEFKNVCDSSDCKLNHLEYRYKDRLYFHYQNIEKTLDEDSILKGYIKDEHDYKSYYRYQVRNKIDISDEIIIINNNQTINDFIDSTVPYQVIGNIDYSSNGIYTVNIVTNFITIPLKVEVLILDNIMDSYNKDLFNKNLDIEKLNKQIEFLKNDLNNKNRINTEIKEKSIWLEGKINNLYRENSLYQKSILDCKNTNNNYELEISKSSSEINFYKKKIFDLNKIIYEKNIENTSKDSIIKDLNNRINDYELNLSKDNDNLKKLNLCNDVNNNLNKKINGSKTIEEQNIVYILFISIIFFFIGCSILKIKSIKKNN